jgi:hypothetical protein
MLEMSLLMLSPKTEQLPISVQTGQQAWLKSKLLFPISVNLPHCNGFGHLFNAWTGANQIAITKGVVDACH